MNLNQIYLGDAYKLIKEIPDKSIDLIVTDPPYEFGTGGVKTGIFKERKGVQAYEEIRSHNLDKGISLSILNEYVRVLKKINIYLWCNKEQLLDYMNFFIKEHKCNFEIIIWAKTNPAPFLNGHYLKDKEYCLYFWEQGVKVKPTFETGKTVYVTNTNTYDKSKYTHPTIKPLEIIKNLIKNSCDLDGGGEKPIVLDTFIGSGTTAVACKELGINYIGFELNEKFYKIACDRVNGIEASGQVRLF
jgi:site-specific DNA-methyltransferase (adenine-specific)